MSDNLKLQQLRDRKASTRLGGGPDRIEAQHNKGKLTARERLDLLLDKGSFHETDPFVVHRTHDFGLEGQKYPTDSVITGWGTVNERLVYVLSQDFTVFGGSLGEVHAGKICKILDLALKNGAPIIGLNDSGGARIQEGVVSLAGYAEIFLRNTLASGVVPQISVVLGPCAGGAAYGPAITDFIFMVKDTSYMFLSSPDVIKSVTQEEVSREDLGGARTHSTRSGVAHFAFDDEEAAIRAVRELLSYLPLNNTDDPPALPTVDDPTRRDDALRTIVPENPNKPYDMKEVVRAVVDDRHFFEVHQRFAE